MFHFISCRAPRERILAGLWMAAVLLTTGSIAMTAAAQEAEPEESSKSLPRVELAELTGNPGSSLMLPFYYVPDPAKPVRKLSVDIEFVSNSLKFHKASPGIAAEQANAVIETSLTEGTPDDRGITRSKLHITASVPAASREGLPDGLLAYLLFQVSLEARAFKIRMIPSVVAAEAAGSTPIEVAAIATEEGLVNVEPPDVMPEATCFFFSH